MPGRESLIDRMERLESEHRCLNCEAERTAARCVVCGQSSRQRRIRLVPMVLAVGPDLAAGWTRIPATVRDVTLRPATVARGWVAGHRVAHMGPVPYALLAVLVLAATGWAWGGAALGLSLEPWPYTQPLPYPDAMASSDALASSGAQPLRAVDLLIWGPMLVALTAAAFRGVFARVGWHLGEHLVLPLYLAAHWSLLWAVVLNGALLVGVAMHGYGAAPAVAMPGYGAALAVVLALTVLSTPRLYGLPAARAVPLAVTGLVAAVLMWFLLRASLVAWVVG